MRAETAAARESALNQSWLVTAFFFGLLLLILYAALLVLSPFLPALAWAAILTIIVYPGYQGLCRLAGGRNTAAAAIVTVLIAVVILVPVFQLAGFLAEEAAEAVKVLRRLSEEGGIDGWKEKAWVQSLVTLWEWISELFESVGVDLRSAALQGAQLSSGFVVATVRGLAQNVFIFVVNVLIVLFSLFFFLRDGKSFCERVQRLLPMDPEKQEHLFANIVNSVYAVIHGCIVTAMIQGLLAGIAYWFLGIPFAVLLGVVTAFAALFPIGGSSLVWVPASFYLFFQGEYLRGAILLGWGAGIVGTVDNVLKPLLIGTRLRLPMIFLFFSIIGGMNLFGVLGLVLGPVLFALLAALLDLYFEEYVKAGEERERAPEA
jgi:predicted PurR-regulated permease PerM